MDYEMDIDLGPGPEADLDRQPTQTMPTEPEITTDALTEEAVYEKVHVRGVDELTTDDIKQFAHSHYPNEAPARVEWIDDTSANIIYSSGDVGLQALTALTQVSDVEDASALPPLRLRSAKLLATHPDSVLQVRSAVKSDRKQARSYEKSRFYLMHPEHDPRERLRQELSDRRRHDSNDGDYKRRRFDDRELRRRRDRDGDDLFGANMYDDQPESRSDPERDRSGRRPREARELFPDDEGSSGRLRNRSASPGRDTLEESDRVNQSSDSRRRFRERSPRNGRGNNAGKELFSADSGARELFPNKPASSYIRKELFPAKPSGHRRSDAFDAADETADRLGRRISVPFVDSNDQGALMRGVSQEDQGFAIRGAAANGISIKGRGASARELFPSKYDNGSSNPDNAGKELFSDTLEGRGGSRRKAQDMFG